MNLGLPVIEPSSEPASTLPRDFGIRLASGLVLAAIALALTWTSVWSFAALVLAVSVIVTWEWGRIVRRSEFDIIFISHASAVAAAIALTALGQPVLGAMCVLVGAILAALLGFDSLGRMSALGVVYVGSAAISLMWFRSASSLGLEASIFLLLVVWSADTLAYVAGRSIGGPKLLPRISPNKTWSGLGGALVGAVAAGWVLAQGFALSSLHLMATAAVLALVSQLGDLMESALKRCHGVKDASGLIPGHGGFMDRVDGLIFAAVAAAIIAALINIQAPARALLTWG